MQATQHGVKSLRPLPWLLFGSRWLQLPLYVGLIDVVMISNLLIMVIIGISSIHLLKTFINAGNLDEKTMLWQVAIHITFLLSAVAIAAIDRIMLPSTVAHMARE